MGSDQDTTWRPSDDVVVVAGTPVGGGQDRAARALAAALTEVCQDLHGIGTNLRVMNVPGRGGADAWEVLVGDHGNPHLLSISSPTLVTNRLTGVAAVGPTDLTLLATLCTEYILFAVASGSRIRTPEDFVAAVVHMAARENMTVALATAWGNVNHIALSHIGRQAAVDPRKLGVKVFDSARYAVAHVLSGDSLAAAVSAASVVPEVTAGRLHPVVVSAPERLGAPLANVPTWSEHGIRCTIGTWRGVVASPGIPPEAIRFWTTALAAAAQMPAWQSALANHLWIPTFLDAAATLAFLQDQESLFQESLADLV